MKHLKQEYSLILNFYRNSASYYVFITAVSFLIIIVLSFVYCMISPEAANSFVDWYLQMIDAVIGETETLSWYPIFSNNLTATVIMALYGFIPVIYLPAFALGLNAVFIGVFGAYYVNHGQSLLAYLVGILPHGIFELTGIVIALSLGLMLCDQINKNIFKPKEKKSIRALIGLVIRVLVFVVLPLIFVASLIEAYITPLLLNAFI